MLYKKYLEPSTIETEKSDNDANNNAEDDADGVQAVVVTRRRRPPPSPAGSRSSLLSRSRLEVTSRLEVASSLSWNKRSIVKFIVLSLELLLLVSVGYSLKRTFEKCKVA